VKLREKGLNFGSQQLKILKKVRNYLMIMVSGMMLIINNFHVNVDHRIALDTLFEKAPDGELIRNLKKIILELINNFSQK
jgi:hypothetical protein